jgi:HAE1 family hydrophobic/amphiphilic exporter-1
MNVSRRFIDFPVMTTLVMAALVIFGLVGYFTLPVNELPNVDFPTISVNASLPGADLETMVRPSRHRSTSFTTCPASIR